MKTDSVTLRSSDSYPTDSQAEIQDKEIEECNYVELLENYSNDNSEHRQLDEELSEKSQPKAQSPISIFGTTAITIFLAEIGDKTQLSTLMMSAQSHQPWVVFIGSGVALITTSLLGVALGSWISSKLSPKAVNKAAGVTLLLVSLMLFGDVIVGW